MYTKNKVYTKSTKDETIKNIDTIIDANLGGTELLKPFEFLLSLQNTTYVNIFVLTDGQVFNRKSLTNHIKKNKKFNFRIFTIGFGYDTDRNLCAEVAKAGCGRSDMCVDIDGEELKKTLINQLSLSRKDYYFDIQLHLGEHATILKDSHTMPNSVYKILTKMKADKKQQKVKLTYVNSSTRQINDHTIICDISKDNEVIKKMFIKSMISSLEEGNIHHGYDIVDLSINNNILSSKTAFILVDNTQKVNVDLPLVTEKVTHFSKSSIPLSRFIDYSFSDNRQVRSFDESFNFSSPVQPNTEAYDMSFVQKSEAIPFSGDEDFDMNYTQQQSTFVPFSSSENMFEFSNFGGSFSNKSKHTEFDQKSDVDDDGDIRMKDSEQHDISQYQNFNGSFKVVDEIFKIIGITKQQIIDLAKKNNCTFEKQLYELIKNYLSNKPEYIFILNKLNKYLSEI